jgi:hypothetical protein
VATAPPAPHLYELARIYAGLAAACRRGDRAAIDRTLGVLLGLNAATPRASPRVSSMLAYRGFKPAELAMLAAGDKPVVKFEDIPLADADAFVARMDGRFQLVRSEPYVKDGLLLRSERPVPGREWLVTIYASRDDRASRLAALEAASPDDARGAGRLLGFPECCIDAFIDDMQRSREDQDTVNDDACRRVLETANPGHALLCPLSNLELIGFYPCHTRCPEALALAERNLMALEQQRPGSAAATRRRLAGSYLFYRLPFFVRLPHPPDADGWVATEGWCANVFPHQPAATVQRRFAAQLAATVAGADAISVRDGVLWRRGARGAQPAAGTAAWPPIMAFFEA